jgi:putative membrane protein
VGSAVARIRHDVPVIARIIVSGTALVVAALLVPDIELRRLTTPVQAVATVGLLALIFGLVNAYLRPILKLLALPLNLLTMGLFSFVLNAGLLLFVAWIADVIAERPLLRLGGFPPQLDAEAILAAVLGSVVISAASTVMTLLTPDT